MAENTTSPDAFDRVKDATLKYSGYAYLLGDLSMAGYGLAKREYGTIFTGLSWGVGGFALAAYGKQSPEYQLHRLSADLASHLQNKEGVRLPKSSELYRAHQKASTQGAAFERFMYDHPSQILNGTYALGSLTLLYSGLRKRDFWQAASGALVGAGALGGILIPEKEHLPKDEQTQPISVLNDPVGWFQEKPLRWSGLMYTLNNATLVKSGFDEMRANPANKNYLYKYFTVGSYLMGNALLALSHKDRTKDVNVLGLESLEREAAEIIATQTIEKQEPLINSVAYFLASKPQIHQNAQELADGIRSQLAQRNEAIGEITAPTHEGRLDESRVKSI